MVGRGRTRVRRMVGLVSVAGIVAVLLVGGWGSVGRTSTGIQVTLSSSTDRGRYVSHIHDHPSPAAESH